jgi:flagellar biosynthesis/type III secretory pathway protein FliH
MRSSKSGVTPPLATDLESLLELELRLERIVADARDDAARMLAHARARAEGAANGAAAIAEHEQQLARTEADDLARKQIDGLERDAAARRAGYRAVIGRQLDAVAERVCDRLVRAIIDEERT